MISEVTSWFHRLYLIPLRTFHIPLHSHRFIHIFILFPIFFFFFFSSFFRYSTRLFSLACRASFLHIAYRSISSKRQRLCVRAAVRTYYIRTLATTIKRYRFSNFESLSKSALHLFILIFNYLIFGISRWKWTLKISAHIQLIIYLVLL